MWERLILITFMLFYFTGCILMPTLIPLNTKGNITKIGVILLLSGCFDKKNYTPEETHGEICQTAINSLREQVKVCKIEAKVIENELSKCRDSQ